MQPQIEVNTEICTQQNPRPNIENNRRGAPQVELVEEVHSLQSAVVLTFAAFTVAVNVSVVDEELDSRVGIYDFSLVKSL